VASINQSIIRHFARTHLVIRGGFSESYFHADCHCVKDAAKTDQNTTKKEPGRSLFAKENTFNYVDDLKKHSQRRGKNIKIITHRQ
jgi:hypothetical protein